MQATSTLSAYAGQTITISGTGSIEVIDFDIILEGTSSVLAVEANQTSSTLSASSLLYAEATMAYGYADLPGLNSLGRAPGVDVAFSYSFLQSLYSTGYSNAYTPGETVIGYGNLTPVSSFGIITQINIGSADQDLPAALSSGGDYVYGVGDAILGALLSSAHESYLGFGKFSISNISIEAETETTPVGTGELYLSNIKITGTAGSIGTIVLKPLAISGSVQTAYYATGSYTLKHLTVNADAKYDELSYGVYNLKNISSVGSALFMPSCTGLLYLDNIKILGQSQFSGVDDFKGSINLSNIKIDGSIDNPLPSYIVSYTRTKLC